jgi:hypothetical protein
MKICAKSSTGNLDIGEQAMAGEADRSEGDEDKEARRGRRESSRRLPWLIRLFLLYVREVRQSGARMVGRWLRYDRAEAGSMHHCPFGPDSGALSRSCSAIKTNQSGPAARP